MLLDAEKVYYGYMAKCPDEKHKAALELSFLCSNHAFPLERKLEMTNYHMQDECHYSRKSTFSPSKYNISIGNILIN
jgi:hypothetical protein